jgi:hypothetical protein
MELLGGSAKLDSLPVRFSVAIAPPRRLLLMVLFTTTVQSTPENPEKQAHMAVPAEPDT